MPPVKGFAESIEEKGGFVNRVMMKSCMLKQKLYLKLEIEFC